MTMTTNPSDLDVDTRYAVDGYRGVAFRVVGVPKVWDPYLVFIYDDDAPVDDEIGEPGFWAYDDDGEWIDDHRSGQIVVRMVGDDRDFVVDVSDLTPLNDNEFCSCCGQLGCGWG